MSEKQRGTPFVRATCLVSSSCGNTSFSYTSLFLILTKLGKSDCYLDYYSHTKYDGVRGHDGATRIKNVIFTTNTTPLLDKYNGHVTHAFASAWPLNKVMVLNVLFCFCLFVYLFVSRFFFSKTPHIIKSRLWEFKNYCLTNEMYPTPCKIYNNFVGILFVLSLCFD